MGRAGVFFVLFVFFCFFPLCGAALASSPFMRLPASVKLSNRYLLLVLGGSGK